MLEVSISDVEVTLERTKSKRAADDDMVQSVKELGVIQPIAVRKGTKKPYTIIAGRRRLDAAKKAGLHRSCPAACPAQRQLPQQRAQFPHFRLQCRNPQFELTHVDRIPEKNP